MVDEKDEELPPGEIGEIVLRPKVPSIVLDKYYGSPEKTLEAFSNFWFHTGDMGYVDESGNFYYVDRAHFLIRRLGENISSRHIEETMDCHDEVTRSAAFPVPAESGDEDEVAVCVEIDEEGNLSEEDFREYLEDNLPGFMVPKYISFEETLPMTETGKIKKKEIQDKFISEMNL